MSELFNIRGFAILVKDAVEVKSFYRIETFSGEFRIDYARHHPEPTSQPPA
jgi:hypothetical protein